VRLLMHHHMGMVSLVSLGNVNLAWARTNVHTIEQVLKVEVKMLGHYYWG
jgi:hypothetical protein